MNKVIVAALATLCISSCSVLVIDDSFKNDMISFDIVDGILYLDDNCEYSTEYQNVISNIMNGDTPFEDGHYSIEASIHEGDSRGDWDCRFNGHFYVRLSVWEFYRRCYHPVGSGASAGVIECNMKVAVLMCSECGKKTYAFRHDF